MDITIHFKFEKETKGAVRYQECDAKGDDVFDPKVGTFYLRKSALPGKVLKRLELNIKGEE